ncbi:MAG: alkaline phosphatase family protein [Akkermansiaceae bacterium]|nr:alkaline phosphatase family protein [Akkermansiaceae bacterium]MCP5544139.1 alkaline phosphatase family protein [Akkermansiaceae bacterium]MCP5547805.1 alkaline phosphatase family protein [Akkermansiaceae bacterium]
MRTAVINIVGLSDSLLGPHMPRLTAFAEQAGRCSYAPEFPALTCSAQSSVITGAGPEGHGIVSNGWYDRENAEVRFWKQSNHIVRGTKVWETLRDEMPGFTCAQLFWWYNMHSSVDLAVTPRPLYPADGRKVFDIHTQPMTLRDELKRDLGDFPFPAFWGPAAGIASSEWIAASAQWVETKHQPTLTFVYLPHLDYPLQKLGPRAPEIPGELSKIDRCAGGLIDFYQKRGVRVMVLSEYGISAVSRPVHLNRLFRERGWLSIKNELCRETLDCGGSRAFAVADHQIAHVYVNDSAIRDEVRSLLEQTDGVEEVRSPSELWGAGVAAERAGDFIAVAAPDAWFTYCFWNDDSLAPDYARTVDIHRKPGYDPCELFIDPELAWPKLRIAKFLLKKKLGLRGLLDVIPLDASLVKGSHGRDRVPGPEQPVLLGGGDVSSAADIHRTILESVRR